MNAEKNSLLDYVIDKYERTQSPLSVLLELTYDCNFRCVHCYVPPRREKRERLSVKDYSEIAKSLVEMGVLKVTLSGGELFTREDWYQIFRTFHDKGFFLDIFTNASLITRQIAELLKELSSLRVEVSVYGVTADTYEKVTEVPGSFDRFLKGLEYLDEYGIKVVGKPMILKENVAEYEKVMDFIRSRGYIIRIMNDPYLLPCGEGCESITPHEISDDEMIEVLAQGDVQLSEDGPQLCRIAKAGFIITPYGDVLPCPAFPETAGNLKKDDLRSIWEQSPLFTSLRTIAKEDIIECSSCEDKDFCIPCLALNVIETGNILSPSKKNCRITRNRGAAYKRLQLKSNEIK